MKKILILLMTLLGGFALRADDRGGEVVLVYNTRVPESRGVAEHYAQMRHVPKDQIISLDLPDSEDITRAEFHEHLEKPLLKELESRKLWRFDAVIVRATATRPETIRRKIVGSKFRYLVLCYGIPLRIYEDKNLQEAREQKLPEALRRNGAAVDSELSCLPIINEMMLAGPSVNPEFAATNGGVFNPTNDVLMVTRLDGPTASIANALVDKAMDAETNGLWGRAYFDLRGITNEPYAIGDAWIAVAADTCVQVGFETVVDKNPGTFPTYFPLSQVAFYAGWYDENVSGPFALPTVEFMPGAFAYHLHSFSAATLRSTKRQWVGPLLARGVTATMGCVDEPYLGATPNIAVFFQRFVQSAFTFGEAACACQKYLSWQTTVVGDPLYRPFGGSPVELQANLVKRHSKYVEWADLRDINAYILHHIPMDKIIAKMETSDDVRQSAVLEEKLGDMYSYQTNFTASVVAYRNALKLDPSPQQRTRIMLELATQFKSLGRTQEAYETYQQFLKVTPQYPDLTEIYQRLLDLAHQLSKNTDAQNYERHLADLNPNPKVVPNSLPPAQRAP